MPTRSTDKRSQESYQLKEVIQDYTEKLGEITYLNRKLKEELELVLAALKQTTDEKKELLYEFNTISVRKNEFDKLVKELEYVKSIKDAKISKLSQLLDRKEIDTIKLSEEVKLHQEIISNYKRRIIGFETDLDHMRKETEMISSQNTNLYKELEKKDRELSALHDKLEKALEERSTLYSDVVNLRKIMKQKKNEVDEMLHERNFAMERLELLENESNEHKENREKLEDEIDHVRTILKQKEEELDYLIEQRSLTDAKISEYKEKIKDLKEKDNKNEKEN